MSLKFLFVIDKISKQPKYLSKGKYVNVAVSI